MDIDDDANNGAAGARVATGDSANNLDMQSPARSPPPTNRTNGNPHLTSHTSHTSSSPPKPSHSSFDPGKPSSPSHYQAISPHPSDTTMARKKPIKKKGTATAVKPPKRGGKSGGSKKGGSSSRTKVKKPKTEPGDGSSSVADGGSSQAGGDDDSESDQGIYCICRGPDNHRFMIGCDRCEDWFHGDCIGMDKYTGETLVQRYICPNCTDGKLYVTRYKKTCALEGCERPARMYGDAVKDGEASIFCSEEDCQLWWEQLVRTLPRRRDGGLYGDVLTQEEFMGLLGTGKKGNNGGWRLGVEPFRIPADFWETTPVREVLTDEESTLLSNSATERHSLGQEISLCTKMLQLIDLAIKRRDHLIASSLKLPKAQVLGKDFCAYDYRLDSVGASAAFAAFFKSPAGEAIFKTLKLPLPGDEGFVEFVPDEGYIYPADHDRNGVRSPQGLASVLCTRRKCKPHAGWSGIHTKNVKHQIKELAAQAKERLDFEARITDCAAVRFQRRKRENNRVEVVDRDVEMGG